MDSLPNSHIGSNVREELSTTGPLCWSLEGSTTCDDDDDPWSIGDILVVPVEDLRSELDLLGIDVNGL